MRKNLFPSVVCALLFIVQFSEIICIRDYSSYYINKYHPTVSSTVEEVKSTPVTPIAEQSRENGSLGTENVQNGYTIVTERYYRPYFTNLTMVVILSIAGGCLFIGVIACLIRCFCCQTYRPGYIISPATTGQPNVVQNQQPAYYQQPAYHQQPVFHQQPAFHQQPETVHSPPQAQQAIYNENYNPPKAPPAYLS